MPSARLNGCDLYYEVTGSGPDLVFIHGETHGIELFEEQIPYFARRHRCLVYYRRGHGKSASAPYGYSVWNQTLDLAALLDHLAVLRSVLVAVAMASPIAVTFALNHPGRVRAMVLASWYELDGYPLLERRRQKHPVNYALGHQKMHDIIRAQGRQGLIDYMTREGDAFLPILPVMPEVREKVIRMFASHPPEHYLQSVEYYTSLPNLVPQMGMLTCPILGVCGNNDPSPDKPELLQHVPGFREVWIKEAGRFALWERPQEFNEAVEGFLQSLGP